MYRVTYALWNEAEELYRQSAPAEHFGTKITAEMAAIFHVASRERRQAAIWSEMTGRREGLYTARMAPAALFAAAELPETTRGAKIKTLDLRPYLTPAVRQETLRRWGLTPTLRNYGEVDMLRIAEPSGAYNASKLILFSVIMKLQPWT